MPAPAIHWWHMPQNLSLREGMQRAHAVLATTGKGEISGDEDTLRLTTSEFPSLQYPKFEQRFSHPGE